MRVCTCAMCMGEHVCDCSCVSAWAGVGFPGAPVVPDLPGGDVTGYPLLGQRGGFYVEATWGKGRQ